MKSKLPLLLSLAVVGYLVYRYFNTANIAAIRPLTPISKFGSVAFLKKGIRTS